MKKSIYIVLLGCLSLCLKAQDSLSIIPGIITSDIDLFWQCYDAAKSNFKSSDFEKYLQEGSAGVRGFIPYRIESAKKLAKTVKKNQAYYEHIRESSVHIKGTFDDEIRKIYQSLRAWYPEAVFPKAYFVIGRLNSGGTSVEDGLIMGAEMFGPQNDSVEIQARISFASIPGIVAHELIHFQQNYGGENSLLNQCIREGSADFVATLIRNKPLQHHLDTWASDKSEMIWKVFQQQMHDKAYHGWLYGGGKRPFEGQPADLGYWMGFQITKAYYDRKEDKKQAVYDILNIEDFEQFLKDSGYQGKFKKDHYGIYNSH